MIFHHIHQWMSGLTLPLMRFHPALPAAVYGLILGFILIFLYKKISGQKKIARVKERGKAYLLELRLYQDDPGLTLRALKNLFRYNAEYIFHTLRSLIVLMIPVSFFVFHMAVFYDHRPFREGESFLIEVTAAGSTDLKSLELKADPSITMQTPPMHIMDENRVLWRLQTAAAGTSRVYVHQGDRSVSKTVICGIDPGPVPVHRYPKSSLANFVYPGEAPFLSDSFLRTIRIHAPGRPSPFPGDIHWLAAFFLFSVVSGLVSKKIFHVEI